MSIRRNDEGQLDPISCAVARLEISIVHEARAREKVAQAFLTWPDRIQRVQIRILMTPPFSILTRTRWMFALCTLLLLRLEWLTLLPTIRFLPQI